VSVRVLVGLYLFSILPFYAGLFLILGGLLLAGVTVFLVIRLAQQATEASRGGIRQVQVVTTTKDIPDQTLITADGLVVKPFPVDFAPPGAIGSIDQVVGKFANGLIPKDQIVVAGQLAPYQRSANLSDRVPVGRVAVWLPMPDLLATANVLHPGDHVDILLSIGLGGGGQGGGGGGQSTQTTLQNVEVFRLGDFEVNLNTPPSSPRGQLSTTNQGAPAASAQATPTAQGGSNQNQAARNRAIGFLVDHQDAVLIKFIKDSGGTIDLVLRAAEEQEVVRTDAVTLDSVADRFRFRVPQPVVR
jgi:pilus assembly protein CpaB